MCAAGQPARLRRIALNGLYVCQVPKRTNAFQTVVFMIQSHIAGQAKVTESAELTDLVTGEPREVDVCIETQVAGHRIIVSIECRAHARKQDVGWVEEMHTKHSRLPTSRLILVSSSGFSRYALQVARTYNIETIVPEELTEERAAEIGARLSRIRVGRLELVEVFQVRIVVEAIEEPVLVPLELGDMPIFIKAGTATWRLRDIVHGLIAGYYPVDQVVLNAPDEIEGMNLHYENPRLSADGQVHFLYWLMPDRSLSQLHRITLTAPVRPTLTDVPMRHGQFPMRHGQFQQVVYSWGEAVLEGKPTMIVATKADDGNTTVSLRNLP
jgi:hypothetical protein